MANDTATPPKQDHRESPMYWFAILEIARERGSFEQAAEARQQLKRLGVRVTYERGNSATRGGAPNAR